MRDWDSIINNAEKSGEITNDEAALLREQYSMVKKAGLKKIIKKILPTDTIRSAGKWITKPENLGVLFLGTMAVPIAAEVGSVAYRPIKSMLAYNAMKSELERISPQDVKKYDDEHIKRVYGMVMTVAPVIASNPTLAATAVRDALDMPQSFNTGILANLARVQRDVTSNQIGQKADAIGKNLRGVVSSGAAVLKTLANASGNLSGMQSTS